MSDTFNTFDCDLAGHCDHCDMICDHDLKPVYVRPTLACSECGDPTEWHTGRVPLCSACWDDVEDDTSMSTEEAIADFNARNQKLEGRESSMTTICDSCPHLGDCEATAENIKLCEQRHADGRAMHEEYINSPDGIAEAAIARFYER